MKPTLPTTPPPKTKPKPALPLAAQLTDAEFAELDDIAGAATPGGGNLLWWEFCDGFITAAACTRRAIPMDELLPALFSVPGVGPAALAATKACFADAPSAERFITLLQRRQAEIAAALQHTEVKSLDDPRALAPAVTDVRGQTAHALATWDPAVALPEGHDAPMPAFAEDWAQGFATAVELWHNDWDMPPKGKKLASAVDDALDIIYALLDDDVGPPATAAQAAPEASDATTEGGDATAKPLPGADEEPDPFPPGFSEARMEAFGEAIWAVYDLYDLWQSVGPAVLPVKAVAKPGRNDDCSCGSGKKFKKCHGLG